MFVNDMLRLLDDHRVTSRPVTDGRGHLVDIVSEADLLRDAVRGDPRGHLAPHEKMEQHPSRAEDVMSTLSMKSLPVVDAGVISVQVPR